MTLAALYGVFGVVPAAGMVANACFGAATAGVLVVTGGLLFERRVGLGAGLLWALWPSNVYYTATLFTEPEFTFVIACWMAALAAAARDVGGRRTAWLCIAGLTLGLAAMIKAEPLALVPVELLFLWSIRRNVGDFLRAATIVGLATALVVLPWTYRNYALFGRVIVTSASGGIVTWPGAHSMPDRSYQETADYMAKHRRSSYAETLFATRDVGWRDAWSFIRTEPAQWLSVQRAKLVATYATDDAGADLVRGDRPSVDPFLSPSMHAWLQRIANVYWWAMLALVAWGLRTVPSWWLPARVLVVAIPATWFVMHVLTLSGPRYHAPETLALALLAARGLHASPVHAGSPSPARVELHR